MLADAFVLIGLAFLILAVLCAVVIHQSFVIEKLERKVAYYRRAQARRTASEKPRGHVVKLSEARERRRVS